MSVYLSPVGLAGAPVANQLSVMVTMKERLCKPICLLNDNQPFATVQYKAGTPVLEGQTVFVPVTASIQLLSPGKCCEAVPQMFTERFKVAFQGRTTLPTTAPVITSVGTDQGVSGVQGGRAMCYTINDSVTISIGADASAS